MVQWEGGGELDCQPPPPPPLPQRGSFAASEVIPIISQAAGELARARAEWSRLRTEADEAKALAKKTRADLIVRLRVWGNEGTEGVPIKTSAERQEWADADADVQRAELAADLAQTVQMAARGAYDDAQSRFNLLNGMLGYERDDAKREYGGPPGG